MAKKIADYCHSSKGEIFATVGLSHTGIGDIIRENSNIKLIEFYGTNFQPSDTSAHNNLINSNENEHIQTIDLRQDDASKFTLDYIGGIAPNHEEL